MAQWLHYAKATLVNTVCRVMNLTAAGSPFEHACSSEEWNALRQSIEPGRGGGKQRMMGVNGSGERPTTDQVTARRATVEEQGKL